MNGKITVRYLTVLVTLHLGLFNWATIWIAVLQFFLKPGQSGLLLFRLLFYKFIHFYYLVLLVDFGASFAFYLLKSIQFTEIAMAVLDFRDASDRMLLLLLFMRL